MRKVTIFILPLILVLMSCTKEKPTQELKVLQLNLWHGTTVFADAFEGAVGVIEQIDPDVALLAESNNDDLINRLLERLNRSGIKYYGITTNESSSIISKYPIDSFELCCDPGNRPIIKSSIHVGGQTITLYSAHLDYLSYECYMPRGYSGTSWKKLDTRANDVDSVLYYNRMSTRDESIAAFIVDAKKEREKGHLIILGGDFNEPSHLDWQADTKDLRDHNGLIINWDCSVMLENAGFKDAFREIYPDAVKNPGITFPSANKNVEIAKLAWAPDADERERIDFVYYYPNPAIQLKKIALVGPSQTINRSVEVENDSEDTFILPSSTWPTDHKGNLVLFEIEIK